MSKASNELWNHIVKNSESKFEEIIDKFER